MVTAKASFQRENQSHIWQGRHIFWKTPESWFPVLAAWLFPRFRKDAMRRLRPAIPRDIFEDDSEWITVLERSVRGSCEELEEDLADSLQHTSLRTFHGCRVDDAGVYFQHGLRIRNQFEMQDRFRSVIEDNPSLAIYRGREEEIIREKCGKHDDGRLYVVADDRVLIKRAAHYLIYGSECIAAALRDGGQHVLKDIGIPTLLEIDLPLSLAAGHARVSFARKLLHEWTRIACNAPSYTSMLDFSFCLDSDIPARFIVKHSHPDELPDPLKGGAIYKSPNRRCKYCDPNYIS